MTRILRVSLNNHAVGTLAMLASGNVFFAFDDVYLNSANRPVLSQSFFRPSGEMITESKSSGGKLPPFFSNLLPEGHMRDYLAKRGGINSHNEFKLIELLGQDLSGAVILTPIDATNIDAATTGSLSASNNLEPLRFSLAGIQLKFSAIAERRGGLTIPASGMGGDWIVKLPAQNYPHVPENEYAIMNLASRIGISIPEIQLIPLSKINNLPEMGSLAGSQALAVKRFDRHPSGQRVHIEDFAQVYNVMPDKKYEGVSYDTLTNMVWTLTGEDGLRDFIRRLSFCILTGNGDMHLKNWSFIYEDGFTPQLAPAYDLLSTIPYILKDGLALKLANTKDMKTISVEHFKKMANRAGVPEHIVLETVRQTVDETRSAWHDRGKQDDILPSVIKDRIEHHMNNVTL